MGSSLLDNETRPGQSSAAQAQDAGLVRILCVAREAAYEHFGYTAHCGPARWVVWGWDLTTRGYPIGRYSRYRITQPPHTGNTWPTKQLAASLQR